MPGGFTTLLLAATLGAPVPVEPMPDPLAWGYLGVRVDSGTLRIASVEPNTPAAKAGLHPGDEFVKVGELKPQVFDQVAEHISTFRPGTQLRVEVRRDGGAKIVTVRLGVRPADLPPPPTRTRQPVQIPEP